MLNEVPNDVTNATGASEHVDGGQVVEQTSQPEELIEVSYPVTGYKPYTFLENSEKAKNEADKNGWQIVNMIHTATFTKVTFRKKVWF